MHYQGQCHCGDIKFEFETDSISKGLRCNCSLCKRKGALMSDFILSAAELKITAKTDALGTYQFGSDVAKHHFCLNCGIYPFHETMRRPGYYRVNLGCIDALDSLSSPYEVFDGASL